MARKTGIAHMVGEDLDDDPTALREEVGRLRRTLSRVGMDLHSTLALRGFKVYSLKKGEDLLLPAKRHLEEYYELMCRYSFRLFLRDVIKHQARFTKKDVTRYATAEATKDYISFMLGAGLVLEEKGAYRLKGKLRSFGETLEWFVAETLARGFGAEAMWGVKFKGKQAAGDYDVISKVDAELIYIEVKSSPPKQVQKGEVAAFINRVDDLRPGLSVFLMDTELRMKDKIVPMFEEELKNRFSKPPEVVRLWRELFRISDRTFIINSKGGIAGNLEKVFRWYFGRHDPFSEEV